jgi:hypothetical protein
MIDDQNLPDYIQAYEESLARWQFNQKTLNIGANHREQSDNFKVMTPEELQQAMLRAGTMKPVPELDPGFCNEFYRKPLVASQPK